MKISVKLLAGAFYGLSLAFLYQRSALNPLNEDVQVKD